MDYAQIIGSVAGILTTMSFVPQVVQVVKTKQTRDISLLMFLLFITGIFCWLIYGILMQSLPIILANTFTGALALVILFYKLRYK